ncbi:hypothetical protein GWK47_004633 [Chionoecetes opilio]|uniref:Secreted protein n=1 Tax=Chionoecetes opilio TaxID=41210 RepID=A0A8J4YE43_CHIOP|nr:hypothetical protein GWK47_004633 [Chionoecetes opilio]
MTNLFMAALCVCAVVWSPTQHSRRRSCGRALGGHGCLAGQRAGRGRHVPLRERHSQHSPPSPSVPPHVGTTVCTWRPLLSPVYLSRHNIYSVPRGSPGTHGPPPAPSAAAPASNVTEQPKVWGRVAKMRAGGVPGVAGPGGRGEGNPGVYASSRLTPSPRSDNWRPTLPLNPPQSAPVLPRAHRVGP